MLEGERFDDLLTRAVDVLDRLRDHVSRIGAAECGHGLGPVGGMLFEQIDATRSAAWRAKRRVAY
jgi:hypothetical protein